MRATEEERSEAARELRRRIGLDPPPDPAPDDETIIAAAVAALMADHGLRDLLVYGISTPDR